MTVYAFSSFSFSYLNRARVLAKTLKRLHPDWTLWAVITDKEPEGFSFNVDQEDFDGLLTAEDLFGEGMEPWLFGHDIVEACTAVKGAAIVHILSFPDCEKLFFFDPDIALINGMEEVVKLLDHHSIVLTPHQADPEGRQDRMAIQDNEIAALQYGSFNLGFIALANDGEGRRFAKWWDDRLRDWCHDRLDIGVFVDQKWCNLIPCFFERVKILRDPGYNVASWNLSQRKMTFDRQGNALINGRLLRFYHFTKFGPVGDFMTRRYAADNTEILELWQWYGEELKKASTSKIPKGWWYYANFDNGKPIPKEARELYRERPDLQEKFARPFNAAGDSFYNWLRKNTKLLSASKTQRGFVPI